MLLFSINRSWGYENPSLDIIVTERCSIGGCPLEEACEHCYQIQSAISVVISYIISVYCEDYAGYLTVIMLFLAFRSCSAYFIYLVSCNSSLPQNQKIQPFLLHHHQEILTFWTSSLCEPSFIKWQDELRSNHYLEGTFSNPTSNWDFFFSRRPYFGSSQELVYLSGNIKRVKVLWATK